MVTQSRMGVHPDGWRRDSSPGRGRPVVSRAHLERGLADKALLSVGAQPQGESMGWAMDESKRRVVKFLEKEIKTYTALSLFLTKKGIKEHVGVGATRVLISPMFYRERMREAKKLVFELRKPD